MLKSELVRNYTLPASSFYQRDLERVVNIDLEEIISALKEGDRVELRGFCPFSAKAHSARTGRNPRNGSAVEVAANTAAAFKPGKDMHKRLNAPRSNNNL